MLVFILKLDLQMSSFLLFQTVRQYFYKLNLFPSKPPTNNHQQLRLQYMSTKTFLVTFNLCLMILLFYNAIISLMKRVIVANPTMKQYDQLYTMYSKTLTCPCTDISIDVEVFVSVTYSQHQICDSVYISSEWISSIGYTDDSFWLDDFRYIGPLMFQGIRSLCELARATIENNLKQFYSSHFISALTISQEIFRIQVNTLVEQFIAMTTNRFNLALTTVRGITQANALLSAMLTDCILTLNGDLSGITTARRSYGGNCFCTFSSQCITQTGLYQHGSAETSWSVPGFYVGCYILEALRQSRLECLYNQSCLTDFRTHLRSNAWMDPSVLTQSDSSRFQPNTLFGDIVDKLLVDAWNWTIIYDNYFDKCQPRECSYTETYRNDMLTIITTLISLIGGVTTALRLLIPVVINALFRLYQIRKQNRVSLSQDAGVEEI